MAIAKVQIRQMLPLGMKRTKKQMHQIILFCAFFSFAWHHHMFWEDVILK